MKIGHLPIEIQEKCFERQREQGNKKKFLGYVSSDKRADNFNWSETVEGLKFWELIDSGEFKEFYKLYPKQSNVLFPIY